MKTLLKVRNFFWGWSLVGECFFWENISNLFPKGKIKSIIFYRAAKCGVLGINILTDGKAFPNIIS